MSEGLAMKELRIDLSSRQFAAVPIGLEEVYKYAGSRGLGAKILFETTQPHVDPLSPEVPLIIGAGTLTGTNAPSSGRISVVTKSPATGLYAKSTAGAAFGVMMKAAGVSLLVITGKSQVPAYLVIEDGRVSFEDAGPIWGKNVREATAWLRRRAGRGTASVACIGAAAEKGVKFAGIMFDAYSAAARCGVGLVMASKNLKGIVVKGSGSLSVADPARFSKLVRIATENLYGDPGAPKYYITGTPGSIMPVNESRGLPARNFQHGYTPDAFRVSGQHMIQKGYIRRRRACFSCVLCCHKYSVVPNGPYAGQAGGPEYETIAALGPGCGVVDPEAVLKANELCNDYGLDSISTGSVIQFAMECFEKELLSVKDTDSLDLRFGNAEAVIEMIHRIARREGLGRVLGEGVRSAARAIGRESWKWAVEARGLEQSRVETRSANSYALAFAVNPRGPDHLHAQPIAEFGMNPRAKDLITRITGDAKYANPLLVEKRAEIVRWHEDVFAVTDSLGFCSFTTTSTYGVTPELMAQFMEAAFGRPITAEELMRVGRRTINLERCFNVREGLSRKDDRLPWRLMNEVLPERSEQNAINSEANLNRMLDEYYDLHAWSKVSGRPLRDTLDHLGLGFVADALEKQGLLA
ncbi:MAG: aldehyde ferredoxin oxidoreductase family protein [Firmicutes bacterium]|nr:aldehyde ferredoxin oxidoreductase family protein [Bacillota bacterium]